MMRICERVKACLTGIVGLNKCIGAYVNINGDRFVKGFEKGFLDSIRMPSVFEHRQRFVLQV